MPIAPRRSVIRAAVRARQRPRSRVIKIRQIKAADIPSILRLGLSAFTPKIPYSRRLWTERSLRVEPQMLEDQRPRLTLIVLSMPFQ